jgi:hypothetical protein
MTGAFALLALYSVSYCTCIRQRKADLLVEVRVITEAAAVAAAVAAGLVFGSPRKRERERL